MPERGEDTAWLPVGPDRFRASHAERERVIGVLQAAYVQGRLTKSEFDARVTHALAARTYADLTPLTADLPLRPPEVWAEPPWRPENTSARSSARVVAAATVVTGGAWAGALLSGTITQLGGGVALALSFIWLGIVCLFGSVMLEWQLDKRRRKQLPPGPRDPGRPPLLNPS